MEKRQFIKVNPADNVGIVIIPEGIKAGTKLSDSVTAVEHVPHGHKLH